MTAAVAGALFAALPLGLGSADDSPGTDVALLAPADGASIGSDSGLPLEANGEAVARQGLTQAEAEARMEVLRADRASRAGTRAALTTRPEYASPVPGARLTSCFCMRWGTMHWGIDLAAPMLTPIYAPEDGVVLEAGPASGYGNVIYLQHENGDVTVYGHMEVVGVRAGDIVSAGEAIAKVGSRGYSTGPHLHFEVYVGGRDGNRTDPIDWLAQRGVRV